MDQDPVFEVGTIGGLHLHVRMLKGGASEILATSPHPAVGRHIAKKHAPTIIWTDLNKADDIAFRDFEHILPRYEALTQRARAARR